MQHASNKGRVRGERKRECMTMTERQRERERHATRKYPRKSEGGEREKDREATRERETCNTRVSKEE